MAEMGWTVTDMKKESIGFDFARNPKIHQVWCLQLSS
jgi:hypothetical protein